MSAPEAVARLDVPRGNALAAVARLTARWAALMALPAPVLVGAALLVLVDLGLIRQVIGGGVPGDWANYVEAGRKALAGAPMYVQGDWIGFPYSPLLAYAFGVIAPIGYLAWAGLHVLAATLLPRPLGVIALLTFPFWWDVMAGNLVIFELLLAAWALRGQGWAIGGFLVVGLLVPRPLTLPLIAWLVWQYPAWRLRFVAIVVVLGAATLATGDAAPWLRLMLAQASDIGHPWNLSPSSFIGLAWLPLGVGLAVALLRAGYVGLACLAASPYLLPYYLLFGLLDLAHDPEGRRRVGLDDAL